MKKQIPFKKLDSPDNSIRHKSTNENTFLDKSIKSSNESKKLYKIPLIKPNKKIVLIMNNNNGINTSLGKRKNNKTEIPTNNKGRNLKKILTTRKVSQTLFRNKTENKIEKTDIKKKIHELNKTPTPVKKIKKPKKSMMILESEKNKKEKKYINNPKRSFQSSFYSKKKSHNLIKDEILTIQNTRKNRIVTKKENTQNNIKNKEKKERKLSFDIKIEKLNISLSKIKIITKNYTPPVKYIKKNKKKDNNLQNLNKNMNKDKTNINLKNRISIKEREKNNDKLEILKKLNKNKFVFTKAFYRNKGETMRNKLTSISKDKNKISNTIQIKSKKQKLLCKNNTLDEFKDINNTTIKNIILLNKERNSTCDRFDTEKESKKNYIKTGNNMIIKKLSDINTNNNNKANIHNYLKYTVCALNKIINKKNEIKNNSINQRKSKTIEKDITSLKKSDKAKYLLIHRNTISRFKMKEKNNIKINNISSSNYSTTANTSRISIRNIEEYTILKELGKGSYASVKLAINKNNKNKYAIKIYTKKALLDPQKKNTVHNEIKILKQLNHINIVKLYEVIDTPIFLYLVMEYIEGISLLDKIKKDTNHFFEEQRALKLFVQILKAIIYCQNKNICHRDIKLENILIIKDDIIKLIDFGFAVKTDKETFQNLLCGSPSYMAPEIVNKENYIAQYSDIWSLGVLFYSMLYGRFPFKGKNQEELFKKINEAKVEFPDDIEVNDKIKILLKKILVVIPTQRPSLQEILNDILLLIN